MTRNDAFEDLSIEAAIPNGSVPPLSKQLHELMNKVLWYPMRVAYDRGDRVLVIRDALKARGMSGDAVPAGTNSRHRRAAAARHRTDHH